MALFTKRFIYGIVITSLLLSLTGCIGSSSRAIPITAQNSQLVRQGKYDEAIGNLSKAAKDYPDKGYVWYWLAEAYKGKRDYRSAIACYEKALGLELSPAQKKSANEGLGWCYFWTARFDKAVLFFTKALELDPMWKSPLFGRGLSNKQMGRYDESIKDLTHYLQLAPNDKDAIVCRARSYLFSRKYKESLKDFNKLEMLDRDEKFWLPDTLTGQGWCHYFLGNFKVALAKFDQALNIIAPTDTNLRNLAYRGKAFTQAALGDYPGSFRSIEQARAARNYNTTWDLVLLHYVAGNKKAAWKLRGGAGYVGVSIQDRPPKEGPGVIVVNVSPGSPAQKAGILPRDILTKLGARSIQDARIFAKSVKATIPGTKVMLSVLRQGRLITVPVTIGQADNIMKADPLLAPIFRYGNTRPNSKIVAPPKPPTRVAHIPETKHPMAHIPKQPRLPTSRAAVKTSGAIAHIPGPQPVPSSPSHVKHASRDIKPTSSSQLIQVDQVKAVPDQVSPGDAFDIVVDFTIKDPRGGDRELPVVVERTIYKQGQVVYRFDPVEKTAPNGKPWQLIFAMRAATEKGEYTMDVVLNYNNENVKRSVIFVIK